MRYSYSFYLSRAERRPYRRGEEHVDYTLYANAVYSRICVTMAVPTVKPPSPICQLVLVYMAYG